jgi:hypothetical protein
MTKWRPDRDIPSERKLKHQWRDWRLEDRCGAKIAILNNEFEGSLTNLQFLKNKAVMPPLININATATKLLRESLAMPVSPCPEGHPPAMLCQGKK